MVAAEQIQQFALEFLNRSPRRPVKQPIGRESNPQSGAGSEDLHDVSIVLYFVPDGTILGSNITLIRGYICENLIGGTAVGISESVEEIAESQGIAFAEFGDAQVEFRRQVGCDRRALAYLEDGPLGENVMLKINYGLTFLQLLSCMCTKRSECPAAEDE